MAEFEPFIKVEIVSTKGSTPRNRGAQLFVSLSEVFGSIGGGRLEEDAISHARELLRAQRLVDNPVENLGQNPVDNMRITLGPELGQCCGGVVDVEFFHAKRPKSTPPKLVIFGAGHVGAKLAQLAQAIPFEVELIDNRPKIEIDEPAPYKLMEIPEHKIRELQAGTHVVILTHDHALDFRLTELALLKEDLGFIGMIGSQSKAAQFRSQFQALGSRLDRLNSPIGDKSSHKEPSSVALAVLLAVTNFENSYQSSDPRKYREKTF